MKERKVARVVLDIAMTVMIVLEMLIQFTGEFLHEVIGFALFATVVVHLVFSASWVKKTAQNAKAGKLTARRTALAIVGSLLALTMAALGMSSIAISGILASTGFVWPIGSYSLWATVHTLSSYAFCAIVVAHLAMHWAFLASAFKVPYNPSRRRAISTGVNAVAALGVLALGVTVAGKMTPQIADAYSGQVASGSSVASNTSESSTPGLPNDSGKTSKPHGKNSGGASSGSAAGSSSSGSASSGSSSEGNAGSGSTSSGSSATGICTLCRKQCPLSAPKCDKPYKAGLL